MSYVNILLLAMVEGSTVSFCHLRVSIPKVYKASGLVLGWNRVDSQLCLIAFENHTFTNMHMYMKHVCITENCSFVNTYRDSVVYLDIFFILCTDSH